MRKIPAAWVSRLNDTVKAVRRRQGWSDIFAVVEPPLRPGQSPTLRVEKTGAVVITPLEPRMVETMMRTGQEGPVVMEIKRAFMQVLKTARKRQTDVPAGPRLRR